MVNEITAEIRVLISKKAEFEQHVKENMKRAYYVALGFLGSHDSAMEVSQEAFIRAYRSFGKYDGSKKFFTWYYKILRNLCLNAIRNKKRRKEIRFFEINPEIFPASSSEESYDHAELILTLEETMLELSIEDREIIILKEFENLSYKEIAELLGIPAGSVMSRLFYARKRLAEKMKRKV